MSVEKFVAPERPAYRVLSVAGFWGDDDTLYAEGAEIYFDGEPSLEMEPLNEPARLKMVELMERLDDLGRKAAEKIGKAYSGMPRTLDGALAIASAIQREEMSVMGVKEKDTSIKPVNEAETPEFGTGLGKRARGRPRKV